MSAPADSNKGRDDSGAESPTTARPLDLDDDDVQETGITGDDSFAAASTTATGTGVAPQTFTATTAETDPTGPPKPPRPMTEAQKNIAILKEAFPNVDEGVIKAVLSASSGRVEPAFNALLEMTDPDAVKNEPVEVPPPQPPRPQGQQAMSQLEADELYARQLAEHYDNVGSYEARTSNRGQGARRGPDTRQAPVYRQDDEREHSFLDDDLPVIRENLRKGFLDTQTKVNSWITTIRKRIEDGLDETEGGEQRQGGQYGSQYGGQSPHPGSAGGSRRSGDYDADPQVLSDDFAGMRFSPDGTPVNRTASHGLYQARPKSSSPRPGAAGRKVGFSDETEEINMYDTSPTVPPKDAPSSGQKASKWQPLSSVEPNPIVENDPFSLGDSEDEREAKDKPKDVKADAKPDDNERLKQAAAEAMADSLVDQKGSPAAKTT